MLPRQVNISYIVKLALHCYFLERGDRPPVNHLKNLWKRHWRGSTIDVVIWLGIDLGEKRIGLAVSDEMGWAHPVTTLRRYGGKRDLEAIGKIARQRSVEGIVVGLPLNMDGTEGRAAEVARRFSQRLAEALKITVRLRDERLTSWEAEQMLREAGVRGRRGKKVVDQMAAVIILKDFLAEEAGK